MDVINKFLDISKDFLLNMNVFWNWLNTPVLFGLSPLSLLSVGSITAIIVIGVGIAIGKVVI